MSANQVKIGTLLNLITADKSFYHKLYHFEREKKELTAVRNAYNIALFTLVGTGKVNKEEIIAKITERENICYWFTEKHFPQEKSENRRKQVKMNQDAQLSREHKSLLPVCHTYGATEDNGCDGATPPTNNTALTSKDALIPTDHLRPNLDTPDGNDTRDFCPEEMGQEPSSAAAEIGNAEYLNDELEDQQALAVNIFNESRRNQGTDNTLTEKEKATSALKDTIKEMLKGFKPAGTKNEFNQIINNNKNNLVKRLIEIVQYGEHITGEKLGPLVQTIASKLLPSSATQYESVYKYLLSTAKQPKKSKFGAILYLIVTHHASWDCSPHCQESTP